MRHVSFVPDHPLSILYTTESILSHKTSQLPSSTSYSMVVDTTYYELLELQPTATYLEIKKSYRRLAIRLHPDKNPDDPQAHERFQEVGEAYQVLSDEKLREKYDKYGKQESVPVEGFEDPTEFFSTIFGGEAFGDWIGELSLLKEMAKAAELSAQAEEGKEEKKESAAGETSEASHNAFSGESADATVTTLLKPGLLLENGGAPSSDEIEKKKRQEELDKFEEECRVKKIEMRNELLEKLIKRLLFFTESDMSPTAIDFFRDKLRTDAEYLKLESFGLKILHTLGSIYQLKAKIFLKSQGTFGGLTGLWWKLQDKGGAAWGTISTVVSALDAQQTMQEYSKMQDANEYHVQREAEEARLAEEESKKAKEEVERLEDELNGIHLQKDDLDQKDQGSSINPESNTAEANSKEPVKPTQEELQEKEQLLVGKILAAAWSGSKFEIQGNVRAVCEQVLYDESVPLETRIARAKGMKIIGKVFSETTRTELEAEEARVFEELVAEASQSKSRKKKPQADSTQTPESS